jgi:hypothetical protein
MDGLSILSHLISGASLPDRQLFWHYPHYHSTGMMPAGAIRKGPYKLIEWYEEQLTAKGEGAYELYDLQNDISEAVNLVDSLPDMVREMSGELGKWREEIHAQMPVPNPKYN